MSLRSARLPALLLLAAAAFGLVLANSPLREGAFALKSAQLIVGVPGLSVGGVIEEGLLAVFFFIAAVELRVELTSGLLASPRRAMPPALAALGGVLAPIAVYLAIARTGVVSAGWSIPTATDVAFALGVLAIFGRALPPQVRVFLLALAILDDIVGIVFIAALSATGVKAGLLLLAAVCVAFFGVCSRRCESAARRRALAGVLVSAPAAWLAAYASGVHPTIAGVALGLVMAPAPARTARHALEPWVNGAVLPLFALSAALVVIPPASAGAPSPAFWGVLVALPLGKLVGIVLAGAAAQRLLRHPDAVPLALGDLLAVGALGGIGFTVSLLLTGLVFAQEPRVHDDATLGVLAGSAISLVLAAILVSWRSWHHRNTTPISR
ncbi:MAG: Na+/H+ antiporter NhaA [Microbacterium sp.]